ncbi:HAD-IIA family hydrolase [Bellilinea caldifistulae]|uniref:HAD family hydrolase n=1 Tax=Bellilinea caldifistulae TaxID=360411 RepID=A0A0P6XBF7_9CHLR|nr:HAD family hydrolase [Bellilinea caldifistulae]
MRKIRQIRCFLLDMDGTVFLGNHLLPGAVEFIEYLENGGIPFYFLTNNSSRSKRDYVDKLNRMGLCITQERVFSSGEATALYLKKTMPSARLFIVGTDSLIEEFRQYGFEIDENQPEAVVLGFDTTLTYSKLWKLCNYVRLGLPYIATHPDINCPTENGSMPDIGAMIAFVQASTTRLPDVIIGKPNPPIVEIVSEKSGLPLENTAMIGDRLYTDIALGRAGITTILVLTGETKLEDVEGSPYKPDVIVESLLDLYNFFVQNNGEKNGLNHHHD